MVPDEHGTWKQIRFHIHREEPDQTKSTILLSIAKLTVVLSIKPWQLTSMGVVEWEFLRWFTHPATDLVLYWNIFDTANYFGKTIVYLLLMMYLDLGFFFSDPDLESSWLDDFLFWKYACADKEKWNNRRYAIQWLKLYKCEFFYLQNILRFGNCLLFLFHLFFSVRIFHRGIFSFNLKKRN